MKQLLYFGSSHCAPCHAMLPLVREIAAAHGIQLHEYDRDECGALARAYGVQGVPCLILMDGSVMGDRIVGLVSRARIEGLIGG